LPLRSISNPGDIEEVEDDPLHHRRKQQSQLMSAAVERARKRREEEERQLKEKQMAAAREKLRQLEEKVGKKPAMVFNMLACCDWCLILKFISFRLHSLNNTSVKHI